MIFTPATYVNRADAISKTFGDDGTRFEVQMTGSEDTITIEEMCIEQGASVSKSDDGRVRYSFADGSSIVVSGDAWDLGIDGGCFCWAGVGHVGCGHPDAKTL